MARYVKGLLKLGARFLDATTLKLGTEYLVRTPISLEYSDSGSVIGVNVLILEVGWSTSISSRFIGLNEADRVSQLNFIPDGEGQWVLRNLPLTQGYTSLAKSCNSQVTQAGYIGILVPAWRKELIKDEFVVGYGYCVTKPTEKIPLVLLRCLAANQVDSYMPLDEYELVSWCKQPGYTVADLQLINASLIFPGLNNDFRLLDNVDVGSDIKEFYSFRQSGWDISMTALGPHIRAYPNQPVLVIPSLFKSGVSAIPSAVESMTFDIPDGKHWEYYYLGRDDVSSKPLQIVNMHGLQATIAAGSSSWLISSLKRSSMIGAVVDLTFRPTNRTGLIADIAISPLYPEVKIMRFSVDVCNSEGAFCATIPKTSAFVLKLQPKCRLQLNFTDSVETVRVSVCLDSLVSNYLCSVVGRINLSWNFKEAPQLPKPQEVLSAVKSALTSIEVTCYGDAYACNRVKEELAVAVAEYFKSIKFDSYRKAIILNGEKKQVPLYRVVREGIIVWEVK